MSEYTAMSMSLWTMLDRDTHDACELCAANLSPAELLASMNSEIDNASPTLAATIDDDGQLGVSVREPFRNGDAHEVWTRASVAIVAGKLLKMSKAACCAHIHGRLLPA